MQNYSSRKLELLALKWAVTEKFRSYLLGTEFVVYTDNNPLSHLQSAKLGAVEQRWAAELALFNFKMKYRPDRVNGKADALSRVARGNHEKEILHADDLAEIQLENISVTQSTPVPVELRELVTTYTSQEQLSTSIPEMTFTNLPSHSPAEL